MRSTLAHVRKITKKKKRTKIKEKSRNSSKQEAMSLLDERKEERG